MGSKSGPKAPSPQAQAAAQTQTNKETAYWNAVLQNVNQYTPYGSLTYEQTGGGKQYNMDAYDKAMQNYNAAIQAGAQPGSRPRSTSSGSYAGAMPKIEDFLIAEAPPQFTSTVTLSPEQQQILESQNRQGIAMNQLGEQQIARIGEAVSSPYSYANLQNAIPAEGDIMAQQMRAEEALLSRLNPQFAQQEEALRTRLINQGIGQGSQAYQREMEAFNQAQNDARMQAILSGQQYGANAQNQALQRRAQEIDEYNAQRNAPLNEYIGLTSGTQITNPQFQSASYQGIQPFDIAGSMRDYYSNQQAAANNQNRALSSSFGTIGGALGAAGLLGGIGGTGGTFLGAGLGSLFAFSDERLKENIKPYGKENGYNTYSFNYRGEPETYVGVIAQEVLETNPEAVEEVDGYLAVDYAKIGVEMREIV